jgi:hypothetical protein
MRVIICLDDGLGMIFGGKRQSRDKAVLADIASEYGSVSILPFSEKMIAQAGLSYTLKSSLDEIGKDETAFIESINPATFADRIEELVIYRWNRKYLADMKCTLDLSGFKRVSVTEFVGNAHDKITKEVFKR